MATLRKPILLGIRVFLVISAFTISYFLLRPIYWHIDDQMRNVQIGKLESLNSSNINTAPLDLNSASSLSNASITASEKKSSKHSKSSETEPSGTSQTTKRVKESIDNTEAALKPEPKLTETKTETKTETETETETDAQTEAKTKAKSKAKSKAKTETKTKTETETQPTYAIGVRPIIHEGKPLSPFQKSPIWTAPVAGSEFPPKEEFALRKEMVDFRKSDNVIVVTFANYAFFDFVYTWTRHLTDAGVYNILVGAMDLKTLEALYYEGIPAFDMESKMPDFDPGWGSPIFHKMGREKIMLINIFLSLEVELLICDTDMVWLKNPLPYFARWPEADVFTSSDNVINTYTDDGLEDFARSHAAHNIGILLFRPTDPAKRFARKWAELLNSDDKIWDQNGFNDLMRKTHGPYVEGGNRLSYAFDGSLKLAILPVSVFCSGHTYFVQRMYKKVGLSPYAVHTTYQFAGTDGKRHRLREAKLFFDSEEYYDPPEGFLSYKLKIPKHLLHGGNHTLESHFALVNYQLKQIRSALAIATILNRILVLSEVWCRFDRVWFPHEGILHGTDTPQPFLCPLDHIIEVNRMNDNLDVNVFGPHIPFREYSFLKNPRVPSDVLKSKISVDVCTLGVKGCNASSPLSSKKTIRLPTLSMEKDIRKALGSLNSTKVLEFSTMVNVFGGWNDQMKATRFRKRVTRMVGIWCCINAQPGHIFYNFFYDEIPNWKPRPPRNPREDRPSE